MAGINPKAPAQDLTTNFFTPAPLQRYLDLTDAFADKVASGLHEPIIVLFGSLTTLWIVISGIRLVLNMLDLKKLAHEFVYISIASILVGSQGIPLISWVYSSALSIMAGGADVAFGIANSAEVKSVPYSGLPRLAAHAETSAAKVIQTASALAAAGSLYNLMNYVYAIVLVVPYFLLIVSYAGQIVVAIFRVTMVAIFAPFLALAFAFGQTRSMFAAGCRTLLGTILVLFASTVALALTIYGVSQIKLDPNDLSKLNSFASASNPEFLMILFLGWVGTALMTEGTSMANSIAQTMLTNAAAGVMTAAGGVTAAVLTRFGKGRLGALGGLAGMAHEQLWQNASGGGGQNALDRFKNINNPTDSNKPGGGAP